MTIPASMPARVAYIGDGVTVDFPIPFMYFENTDGTKQIKVALADNDGENEVILIEDTDFTITDIGEASGTLTTNIAPAVGKRLTIIYNIPIEQLTDYAEFGRLPSESIESALDKVTAILKQMQEVLDRCVKDGISGTIDVDTTLDYIRRVYSSIDNIDTVSNNVTAINVVASDVSEINNVSDHVDDILAAPLYSSLAKNSAENAQKWAIGSLQDQPQGSAKYWAENAALLTYGSLNYTNITNCITKIPQDIKLELNNNTLTLKAGSKIYYPNGTGNFEELTVSSDISRATFGSQSKRIFIICIVENGSVSSLSYDAVTNSSSGSNEPTNGNYYNTTTNEISSYVNGEAVDRRTFPIAIVNVTNGSPSSIEQVFNGVGFMGSTIFVLPGVKGLIPNGRNADGSLNNTEFVVENTLTQTRTDLGNEFRNILINATSIVTYTTSVFSYNEVENYIVSGNNNLSYCDVGKCWSLNGKYVQQNTKMSFRAVDYNDIYIFNIPVASLMAYAGNTTPDGWLVCDGSEINRTTYIDLYNVIGTTYGSGNGSTTFNLPNFLNKTFWGGSSSGSIKNAGLPNITGTVGATALNAISSTGCFYKTSNTNAGIYGSTSKASIVGFNAANSNSIYGSSSTVQPPAVQTLICIKY